MKNMKKNIMETNSKINKFRKKVDELNTKIKKIKKDTKSVLSTKVISGKDMFDNVKINDEINFKEKTQTILLDNKLSINNDYKPNNTLLDDIFIKESKLIKNNEIKNNKDKPKDEIKKIQSIKLNNNNKFLNSIEEYCFENNNKTK